LGALRTLRTLGSGLGHLDRDAVLLRVLRNSPGGLKLADQFLEHLSVGSGGQRFRALLRKRPYEIL
jgi:hypothetical protein